MRVKQGQEGDDGEVEGWGGDSLRTVIGLIRRKRRAMDRIS